MVDETRATRLRAAGTTKSRTKDVSLRLWQYERERKKANKENCRRFEGRVQAVRLGKVRFGSYYE